MARQVLIGVDPGTVDAGFCLFGDDELQVTEKLHAPQSWEINRRIHSLLVQMSNTAYHHTGLTDEVLVVYERPVYMQGTGELPLKTKNARNINALWMFVGALGFRAMERSYRIIGYNVPDIKMSIAGANNASKELVQQALEVEFTTLSGLTDHEWDALAVARHHQVLNNIQSREIHGDPRARGTS